MNSNIVCGNFQLPARGNSEWGVKCMIRFVYRVLDEPTSPKALRQHLRERYRDGSESAEEVIVELINGAGDHDFRCVDPVHGRWLVWLVAFVLRSAPHKETIALAWRLFGEIRTDYSCIGGPSAGFAIVEHYLQQWNTEGKWTGGAKADNHYLASTSTAGHSALEWAHLYELAGEFQNMGEGDHLYKIYALDALSCLLTAIIPERIQRSDLPTSELLARFFFIVTYAMAAQKLDDVAPHEEIRRKKGVNGGVKGDFCYLLMQEIRVDLRDWLIPALRPYLEKA